MKSRWFLFCLFSQKIVELTNTTHSFEEKLASLTSEVEKSETKHTKHVKVEDVYKKEIGDLKAKLLSATQGHKAESEMALEAVQKASLLERSLNEVNAKVKSLTEENLDLKDQLINAHLEHQTTKSCGSDHSKVPSELSEESSSSDHPREHKGSSSSGVSSDLSDHSDHELEDRHTDFHHDSHHISTQTNPNPAILDEKRSELTHLTEEIEKLTKFKTLIETRTASNVDLDEAGAGGADLADLRIECKQLVTRKHSLESELESYKGEIGVLRRKLESYESSQKMTELERVEFSLRNQLKEWEKKYTELKSQNQALLEEKCELEEAENDSRLSAQRWEQQLHNTAERSNLLSDELAMEQKSNSILKSELDTVQASLDEVRNESSYLEALVQRYEQRIFDLEELEVELREKLALFEGAVHFAVWWNDVLMTSGVRLPSRPMIMNYASKGTTFILEAKPEVVDSLGTGSEDWRTIVTSLKSDKMRLTETLNAMMAEKESLAISLEGNHEDKIERILHLEDR